MGHVPGNGRLKDAMVGSRHKMRRYLQLSIHASFVPKAFASTMHSQKDANLNMNL